MGFSLAVIGSGGKTTFIYRLAKILKNYGSVMVSTSTKIFIPNVKQVDRVVIAPKKGKVYDEKGKVVAFGEVFERKKISSPNFLGDYGESLRSLINDFDFSLVECDGSKSMKLKIHRVNEPVLYDFFDFIVCIINIDCIGEKIKDNIHCYEYGYEKYNYDEDDVIDEKLIGKLIIGEYLSKYRNSIVVLNTPLSCKETEDKILWIERIRKITKILKDKGYENFIIN